MSGGIVLLTTENRSHLAVANALHRAFGDRLAVVLEASIARSTVIRKRLRKYGAARAGGQLLLAAYGRLTRRRRLARIEAIATEYGLDLRSRPPVPYWRTPSVNAPETVTLLRRLAPGAVAVWGTRVLWPGVLQAVPAPFINLHAGLTPAYRGFDGGYRALAQGDPAGCGVTVHLIDEGIDTGPILRQAVVRPAPEDTMFTLPLLQLAIGLPLWVEALADALDGRIEARPAEGPSRFWTKPTLGEYFRNGRQRGVW